MSRGGRARSGRTQTGRAHSGGGRGGLGRGGFGEPGAGAQRRYPRVARVNEALREVIAETLESLDDERLELVTVTGIQTDPDLRHAHVYYSALNATNGEGAAEALSEHRIRLQAAIGRQMHLKRTPLLDFRPDPAILEGMKIESIIASMPRLDDTEPDPVTEPAAEPVADAVGGGVERPESTA